MKLNTQSSNKSLYKGSIKKKSLYKGGRRLDSVAKQVTSVHVRHTVHCSSNPLLEYHSSGVGKVSAYWACQRLNRRLHMCHHSESKANSLRHFGLHSTVQAPKDPFGWDSILAPQSYFQLLLSFSAPLTA
jgi:hypothetical protein